VCDKIEAKHRERAICHSAAMGVVTWCAVLLLCVGQGSAVLRFDLGAQASDTIWTVSNKNGSKIYSRKQCDIGIASKAHKE